jgi:hypothetical protein
VHPEIELAYLGIEIPDPAGLTPFFGEVVGLAPGENTPGGALTWRNDDRAHRLILRQGPAEDAVFVGFEAVGTTAYDAIVDRLASAG